MRAFLATIVLLTSNAVAEELPEMQYRTRVVLDPIQETTLSSQVTSTVNAIHYKMGDAFEVGVTLIELDTGAFEALQHKAEAEAEKARTALRAKRELFEGNSASLFDLKEAEANLAAAEAELLLAERDLQACVIKAPYSGKIVDIDVEEHELVQPGQQLLELVDDTVLVAKFLLPSTAVRFLREGEAIRIEIYETGTTEAATISQIGSVIDPASSTIEVHATIDNGEGHLRSGMIGRTQISAGTTADTTLLLIP